MDHIFIEVLHSNILFSYSYQSHSTSAHASGLKNNIFFQQIKIERVWKVISFSSPSSMEKIAATAGGGGGGVHGLCWIHPCEVFPLQELCSLNTCTLFEKLTPLVEII